MRTTLWLDPDSRRRLEALRLRLQESLGLPLSLGQTIRWCCDEAHRQLPTPTKEPDHAK